MDEYSVRIWLLEYHTEFLGSDSYKAAIALQADTAGLYGGTITLTVDGHQRDSGDPRIEFDGTGLLSCGSGLCNDGVQMVAWGFGEDAPLEKIRVTFTPAGSQSYTQTGWTWTIDGNLYERVCGVTCDPY